MRVGRVLDTAVMCCAMAVGLWLSGCDTAGKGPVSERHEAHSDHGGGGSGMQFYVRHPSDAEWLAKAATFHGHLGPWVTVGAMVGQDAVKRLGTPGQWKVQVVCWMPPAKQRPPFSCILDGLQAATGATMGKRNIRLDFSEQVVRDEQPVVYVVRLPEQDRPADGLVYHIRQALVTIMADVSPERLEDLSREIAGRPVEDLLDVRRMTDSELTLAEDPSVDHGGSGKGQGE